MYRQGDVMLITEEQIPTNARPCDGVDGRHILAHGEATGHHHSVAVAGCEMYERDGTLFLRVRTETPLEHQEHAAILVPQGIYRVVRQREYTPEAIRYVAD